MNENNKKRLTASERESLMRLNVALDILMKEGKTESYLHERSKLVPGARRDLAMMAAKCRKLQMGFEKTIPLDQLMTYLRTMESTAYKTGMKQPGKNPVHDHKNFGIWLPYEVINTLLDGVREYCTLCNLDKVGRKQCRMRKALYTIPNDSNEERSDGDCPYFTEL